MQNQNTERIIPKVRYHPTIQMPANGGQTRTRSSRAQRTRPACERPPDASMTAVQENHRVDPEPAALKPLKGAATVQPPDGAPPSPEQVPVGVAVSLDRCAVEQVEVLTRGQRTNQDWFSWRKNRITASVAHQISRCRFVNGQSRTPPTSYLSAITGEGRSIQTRAMTWGVQMEAEAVRRYQRLKSAALGQPVSVLDCGLYIDPQRAWLAASPDGIVTDSRTGERLLCLEVKCPYKHRQRRVEDACRDDRAFCLEIQEDEGRSPVYSLKRSHSYFTQIQCQLAVTGLQRADLVVFTLKETAIVPVKFDPDLWKETVSRLEVFYRDAVLPHLREKTQRPAAAWSPEL